MKFGNFVMRLLTCLVGIPAVTVLILFLPDYNFIGFSLLCMILGLAGAFETSVMVSGKKTIWSILSVIPVLLQYLQNLLFPSYTVEWSFFSFFLLFSLCFASEIISGEKYNFSESIKNISKKLLILIYPSFFIIFIMKITSSAKISPHLLLTFLILVFTNDIFAYVFGLLFGKTNAGILKVSPKKSIAGFAGGFISSICMTFLLCHIFKDNIITLNTVHKIMTGILIPVFADIGDLVESVIKRSSGVKDSGHLFPGRGGVLDSIDSIIFSAPFFYVLLEML